MLLTLLLVFALTLAVGMPVAFSMLISSIAALLVGGTFPSMIIVQRIAPGLDSFPLLAIPLFVLAGNFLNSSGIAHRIFDFAATLVGHIKGGLAHVNILASLIFAGMSGVASADAAGLGQIEMTQMKRAGYEPAFAAALTAVSSVVGPIIPPSVIMVIYSVQASVSLTDLFLAGVIPGLMFCTFLMGTVFIMAHTGRINVEPEKRATFREVGRAGLRALPAILAPVFLLAGLFLGIATPTELGAMIAAYALILGFTQGNMTVRHALEAFFSTVRTCGVLIFIVAASVPFGWIIAVSGLSNSFSGFVTSFASSPLQILLVISVLLLIAGSVIETGALMLIAIPIFLPTILAAGIDPIHFGIVLILCCLVGAITPPFGIILFVMMDVAQISIGKLSRAVLPFYFPIVALLIVICAFPMISLFLPVLLGGM
ncbi:TRAP transporter, DctM subunit [Hoeflea sp. IMCC20628]|uniref:TRAP transporter large permease n=1 Tax=Hoeflea sp. IMCC20628 TaxID=1620421 RepID=UPI00063AAD05|nr:TRAP transporter large permease [Hoeflea sp. IMCC20628]AKH99698.1 TRAP transporter, DctM subunit [Hoeflea sp. IMCC20628]